MFSFFVDRMGQYYFPITHGPALPPIKKTPVQTDCTSEVSALLFPNAFKNSTKRTDMLNGNPPVIIILKKLLIKTNHFRTFTGVRTVNCGKVSVCL